MWLFAATGPILIPAHPASSCAVRIPSTLGVCCRLAGCSQQPSEVCLTSPGPHPISLSNTSLSFCPRSWPEPASCQACTDQHRVAWEGGGGGGVGHVPLHVSTLQLDSADQRSGPLSCFSEPRKAYKSSRWSEQMVPVSGPVAKPENRLHLLGAHKGR